MLSYNVISYFQSLRVLFGEINLNSSVSAKLHEFSADGGERPSGLINSFLSFVCPLFRLLTA